MSGFNKGNIPFFQIAPNAVITNALDVYDPGTSLSYSLQFETNGSNGLDTGVLEANKRYFIYEIFTGTVDIPTQTIASLTGIDDGGPLLPTDFIAFSLVGYAFSDGSANIIPAIISNNQFFYQTPVNVLTGGNSTSFETINVQDQICVDLYPVLILQPKLTPGIAGDQATFRPDNFGSGLQHCSGEVAGVPDIDSILLISINGVFNWKVQDASDSLDINLLGFQFK